MWCKHLNQCSHIIKNKHTYIIYVKHGKQHMLSGLDFDGPDLKEYSCLTLETAMFEHRFYT